MFIYNYTMVSDFLLPITPRCPPLRWQLYHSVWLFLLMIQWCRILWYWYHSVWLYDINDTTKMDSEMLMIPQSLLWFHNVNSTTGSDLTVSIIPRRLILRCKFCHVSSSTVLVRRKICFFLRYFSSVSRTPLGWTTSIYMASAWGGVRS